MARKQPKPITWQWLEHELAKWIDHAEHARSGRPPRSSIAGLLFVRRSNDSARSSSRRSPEKRESQ